MKWRFAAVEASLRRAEFRWKGLRLVQQTSVLGISVCLLLVLGGAAILAGWLTSKVTAIFLLGGLAAAAGAAWLGLLIRLWTGKPDRGRLAAAVERVDRRLLDRLNTLLFLQQRPSEPKSDAFAVRIGRQVQMVLAEKTPESPFSPARAIIFSLTFLVVLAGTVLFCGFRVPWKGLMKSTRQSVSRPARPQSASELTLPTNSVEQNLAWGEVRINDPGTDLKVTKVDVVPLQIEAAANQPLKRVDWFSAVNGGKETVHELPPPAEPRYGVYQPSIFLDELHLSDWDVLTYYAKASTEKSNSYASDVYFLEVRPFREEILKMPGGEHGQAYSVLNEMTSLINRQQHVIRQTHQHVQQPPGEENLRNQDRQELAEAEADLGDSARHLYATMAATMENKPIGQALDSLASAEESLGHASEDLSHDQMVQSQDQERSGLADLVMARKVFQKAVSDHPEAFQDSPQENAPPVADSGKKLSQMAEFRDESKAANDFTRKLLEQQKTIEQQVRSASPDELSRFAPREERIEKAMEDFRGQHPRAFNHSELAQQALAKAADSLQRGGPGAAATTQQATRAMEAFAQQLDRQAAKQQLSDAYRLKQMLDQQVQRLDQNGRDPSTQAGTNAAKLAGEARETINQLKKSVEQEPTRDAFGQALKNALGGQNKVDLDARLLQLQQPQESAARQQHVAQARDALAALSKTFEASQPRSLQQARKSDALQPSPQEGFARGLSELESLIKMLERGPGVAAPDRLRLGQQALADLQNGMRSQFGANEGGDQILDKLTKLLNSEKPPEPTDLKDMAQQLQHFSAEASQQLARQEDRPEVNNIDPAKFPPAYRGRIQKYFEKLSER